MTTSSPLTVIIACGGTGGHLFPGIAIAQQLKRLGHRPLLLISQKSVDAEASRKYGDLEFRTIQAVAKPPLLSLRTPRFLWRLLASYMRCRRILRETRADVVLGMGGFTSLAPIRAGRSLGLRTYVHDSNALPGRANRLIARWCNEVFVGLKEAAAWFPGSRCRVTGTPVRDELLHLPSQQDARRRLELPEQGRVILVTGGSQGAHNLNTLLIQAAQSDPESYYLVIAGPSDRERVSGLAGDAPNIRVIGFCSDMPAAYAAADGVIARSGASTLTELAMLGKACLLVPYPHAADDHQTANARVFADAGGAILCPQRELNNDVVHHFVHDCIANDDKRRSMESAMRSLARPDAAETIARILVDPA